MSSKKIINVGIAGFGRSGYGIHAHQIKKEEGRFKIAAVADCLPERRKDAVEQFGCRVYEDYRDLLNAGGFDLFINATPSRFNAEAVTAALGKGYDVLAEKPLAANLADFDRIAATATEYGKVLYPFQNSRFYEFFAKIREIITSGVLGEIVFIRSNWGGFARRWDWQTLQSELGGNLLNTGPHAVDHAVMLFGDEYPEVFCKMYANHYPFEGDAQNFCALVLYGKGSPTIEIMLNSFQAIPVGDDMYNISGTRGGLAGGPTGLRWKYFKPEEAPVRQMWEPWSHDRQYCSEKLPWIEESCEFLDNTSSVTGAGDIGSALYANLYDVLANGAAPKVTIEQVRRQIYVMEEAHKQNPLPARRPG